MRNLKWYYIIGLATGIVALIAVVTWIFRTTDLLSRLGHSSSDQPEELE